VDRPAREGDLLLVDFVGTVDGEPFQGGEARDYMLEIGGDRLVEGFEHQLMGAVKGDARRVEVDFPPGYREDELAGKHASFEVEVKDVREKRLPQLDDEFASAASEFETIAELRADIGARLEHAQEHSIEDEFREAAVEAAAAEASIELPGEIVTARAQEMWDRMEHSMHTRGMDPDSYLKAAGKTREQVVEEVSEDAARQLARDSVLEAVAEAEKVEVSDEEVVEILRGVAEREGMDPEKMLQTLKKAGRDLAIRRDLRLRKAIDVIVEHAKPIDPGKAKARERLWTPWKKEPLAGKPAAGSRPGTGQLWTPGSEPPGGS
jgi:trigger factor